MSICSVWLEVNIILKLFNLITLPWWKVILIPVAVDIAFYCIGEILNILLNFLVDLISKKK